MALSARNKATTSTKGQTNSRNPSTLSPNDVDLNVSHLSGFSAISNSTVVLGGTQYPVGTRIGSSGMFVIADPMTDFNPKGPDSLYSSQTGLSQPETGSINSSQLSWMQVGKGAYPIQEKGYFEDWNFSVIRWILSVVVLILMVILLAATIGLSVQHEKNCDILFEWWEGANVYLIQVPVFSDSDSNDVGDIKGIGNKVDYLTYLGIDMVILSNFLPSVAPFFTDLTSFVEIDPRVGKLREVPEMIKTLHDRDVKVLLELTLATTSNQHVWFEESREQNEVSGNRFTDFYVWESLPDDPLNTGKWKPDPLRGQYYYHRNDSTKPVLNWVNPKVQDAVEDVLRHWLSRGVDGFLIRDMQDLHFDSEAEVAAVLQRWRDIVDSYEDKKLLMVDGDYLEKVWRRDEETFQVVKKLVDTVQMPLIIAANTTFKLQWDIDQSLKWQRQQSGPQTLWVFDNYGSTQREYVAAVQMYIGMLPGNPSFKAGHEIGVHYDKLEDRKYKPMLWESDNIYPYLPGSKLNSTTIKSLRNTLRSRQGSYALRKDNNGKRSDNGDKVINLDFKVVDAQTLLLERYFRRQDSYYYGGNFVRKLVEPDWQESVAHGEMVADTRGQLTGSIRTGTLKLHPAQSLCFKVVK